MTAARPPLDLHAEVLLADGTTRRWASEASAAGDVPQNINFKTRRGDGFADGTVVLARPIDRDYGDLNLLDGLNLIGNDGSVAYEGRVASIPRSVDTTHSITVQTTGWSSHAKDRRGEEIIVDRDFTRWVGPSVARRLALLGASASPVDPSVIPDATTGQPSLSTSPRGPWTSNAHPFAEAYYDSGGIPLGSLYYAWKIASTVSPADSNWTWGAALSTDDIQSVVDYSGSLRAAGPSTGIITATASNRLFALAFMAYGAVASAADNMEFGLYWTCLAVYGNHGLTKQGTEDSTTAKGFYASDVLRYIFGKYCPKLSTAGIQDSTYVIQQLEFRDPTFPWDMAISANRFHRWDLGVWDDRTVTFRPIDLSDYDWEVRIDDPGVTVSLQGDSIGNFGNGIEVTYTDVSTGATRVITPDQYTALSDTNPENPANTHGDQIWLPFTITVPVTLADALQIGRAALADLNQPRGVGEIGVQGHIRDRAGHWQPVWKVRAGDRIAITDSTALSDRPRIIGETDYTHPGRLNVAVDSSFQRVDAILDRIITTLAAHNLLSA